MQIAISILKIMQLVALDDANSNIPTDYSPPLEKSTQQSEIRMANASNITLGNALKSLPTILFIKIIIKAHRLIRSM